jgi:hypothetical protein
VSAALVAASALKTYTTFMISARRPRFDFGQILNGWFMHGVIEIQTQAGDVKNSSVGRMYGSILTCAAH